ncbi:hypothetical protein AB7273_20625 [Providencia alcalifaciens]
MTKSKLTKGCEHCEFGFVITPNINLNRVEATNCKRCNPSAKSSSNWTIQRVIAQTKRGVNGSVFYHSNPELVS